MTVFKIFDNDAKSFAMMPAIATTGMCPIRFCNILLWKNQV